MKIWALYNLYWLKLVSAHVRTYPCNWIGALVGPYPRVRLDVVSIGSATNDESIETVTTANRDVIERSISSALIVTEKRMRKKTSKLSETACLDWRAPEELAHKRSLSIRSLHANDVADVLILRHWRIELHHGVSL